MSPLKLFLINHTKLKQGLQRLLLSFAQVIANWLRVRVSYFLLALLLFFFASLVLEAKKTAKTMQSGVSKKYAMGLVQKEQYDEAIKSWRKILGQYPHDSESYYFLAKSFFHLERYKQASEAVQKAILYDHSNLEFHFLYSRILMGATQYAEAEQVLLRLKKWSSNQNIYIELAQLYAILGNTRASMAALEEVESIASDNLRFLLTQFLVYEKTKTVAESEQYLEDLLVQYALDPTVHKVAASYFFRRSHYQRAIEEVGILKKLGLQSHPLATLELRAYYLSGAYGKTVQRAAVLLQTFPQNTEWWYIKALAQVQKYDYENALESLAVIQRLDSEHDLSQITIDGILREHYPYPSAWHTEEAAKYVRRAREEQEHLLYDDALHSLRFGLQIDPLSEQNWMAFADVFRSRGNYGKYLEKLYAWKQSGFRNLVGQEPKKESGNADSSSQGLNELIALYEASRQDIIVDRWKIEKQSLLRKQFDPIQVFVMQLEQKSSKVLAQQQIASHFVNILQWYESPHIVSSPVVIGREAEVEHLLDQKSDFYLILRLAEGLDSSVLLDLDLYLSKTGSWIRKLSSEVLPKGKMTAVMRALARDVHSLFPRKAQVVKTSFSRGLLNQGSFHQVKVGQKWTILDYKDLQASDSWPYLHFDPNLSYGNLTITDVTESFSVGKMDLHSVHQYPRGGAIVVLQTDLDASQGVGVEQKRAEVEAKQPSVLTRVWNYFTIADPAAEKESKAEDTSAVPVEYDFDYIPDLELQEQFWDIF